MKKMIFIITCIFIISMCFQSFAVVKSRKKAKVSTMSVTDISDKVPKQEFYDYMDNLRKRFDTINNELPLRIASISEAHGLVINNNKSNGGE